ncbi:MAG: aminoglycoside/choline kinase family phosphotransferase [Yoonia sp.]|jgi:aminoglycoside/choline kinase family phosphotransferase
MMSNRTKQITEFLAKTPWATWTQVNLAGDASSRRYFRLSDGENSAILMDANPKTGETTEAFTDIGQWIRSQSLCAPKVLLHNTKQGFLLLEDLGREDFAMHLAAHPTHATTLYTEATDILIQLDAAQPPKNLTIMTPEVGGEMVGMTAQWYGNPKQSQIVDEMIEHLTRLCPIADTMALRDYHAENLIWRPGLEGTNRIGLLDYQDAFIAPRGYDLVSLLRDVRRRVDPNLGQAMSAYFIAKTGAEPSALACLAVQRNLRILGVFSRLARRDQKLRYIAMIPHIWAMIMRDLQHPALQKLQTCVAATLPAPENSAIKDLL